MLLSFLSFAAIVEPNLTLSNGDDETGGGSSDGRDNGDNSNMGVGIIIATSIVGGLLIFGVVVFLIVLSLVIRRKHKTNKYSTSTVMPVKVFYNQNGYVRTAVFVLII